MPKRNPRFLPGGDRWLRKRTQLAKQLESTEPHLNHEQRLSRAEQIIRVLWNIGNEDKKKAPGIERIRNKTRKGQ
jgi:hypothetical protein